VREVDRLMTGSDSDLPVQRLRLTMKPSPPVTPPGRSVGLGHQFEGYSSLALTVLLLAIPFLPGLFPPFETAIGLTILALILVLGHRGLRSGRGGGRIAARLSITVLIVTMVICLVIACIEVSRDLSSSRP
jgi:hypothetical protein